MAIIKDIMMLSVFMGACAWIAFFGGGFFIVDNFLKLGTDQDTRKFMVGAARFLAFLGLLASVWALYFYFFVAPECCPV